MEKKKNSKQEWNKPHIKSHLSIRETLGTDLPGSADTNPGGQQPRS